MDSFKRRKESFKKLKQRSNTSNGIQNINKEELNIEDEIAKGRLKDELMEYV